MGIHSYGGKPRPGERAGASYAKVNKEISRDRIVREATKAQTDRDKKRRVTTLEREIREERDSVKREPLYEQLANAIASFPPEVVSPSDVRGIVTLADLDDNELLEGISRGHYTGTIGDFLPLHHTVKLLAKTPHDNPNTQFIYLANLHTDENTPDCDLNTINLRALEYFLITFSNRISSGQRLDLKIDNKRLNVPYNNSGSYAGINQEVAQLRNKLKTRGIRPSDDFQLKKIRVSNSNSKIRTTLHVKTERKHYKVTRQGDTWEGNPIISYLHT